MKLRVGVVGLGEGWESRYRPALRSLADRFELRAICAEVAARAEQVAAEFNAHPIDGYRALAARADIDAVLMLSPAWYGSLPILAACELGKAIYCAAALDLQPDQAGNLKQRVDESGVAFMAEFPRRQAPATLRLKELIATRLGPPRMLFCHYREKATAHRGRAAASASACAPSLRHLLELVDWCCYVVNADPESVNGVQYTEADCDTAEYEMMSLDFRRPAGRRALAQISIGRYLTPYSAEAVAFRPPAELQVCCEHGVAFIDLPSTLIWFDSAGRHLESLESERPVGEQMLMLFHRAVTSLVRKTSDLEDAYRALQIVTAARESSRLGHRIVL